MHPDWWRHDASGRVLTLTIHVQPNARTSRVVGAHGDALKIRIAAPAVDDKANAALVDYLAETLGVPAGRISLTRGLRGRRKSLQIREAAADLVSRLEAVISR